MSDTSTLRKVSIGFPVYNGEEYLELALESLLAQTHTNFELTICDNASTDSTEQICREFAQRDSRITYYRNTENIGAVKNFNKVFELATTDYFMWAAHDDMWTPTYMECCIRELDANPDAVLACSDILFIDEAGEPITERAYNFNASLRGPTGRVVSIAATRGNSIGWYEIYGVLRSEALRKTNMMQNYFGSDVVLMMELLLQGPFVKVSEKLFLYREFRDKTIENMMAGLDTRNVDRTWPHPWSDLCRDLAKTIEDSHYPRYKTLWMKALFFFTVAFGNPRLARQIRLEQRRLMMEKLGERSIRQSARCACIYLTCAVTGRIGRVWLNSKGILKTSPN